MPVIAYKTMTITAICVQIRRILCQHCAHELNYLLIGSAVGHTTGLPLISREARMREVAAARLEKAIEKLTHEDRQGAALCPFCKRYQPWMVSASRRFWWTRSLLLGAALGIPVGAFGALAVEGLGSGLGAGAGAVLGLAIGALVAALRSISVGPHPDLEDGRAMFDEELEAFLEQCTENDYQPALAWYIVLDGTFPEKTLVVPLEPYAEQGLVSRAPGSARA
jgi:hypothetical protein